MALHQKPQKKDRRPWAALLVVLVVSVGWCSAEDEEPAATVPSEPVAAAVEPLLPETAPISLVEKAEEPDAPAPPDAGVVAVARKEPDIEDYMRRWREALAPLFQRSRTYPGSPTLVRATPRESVDPPDAGTGPCKPKVQRLEFTATQRFDLVIVVDTSGSMRMALPRVVRWLAELEQQIVVSKSDTQLLVLADQQSLGRTQADGGLNWRVGSTDALEVLLTGTRTGRDRWIDSLRSGAELQIVVVTDDESRGGNAPDYVARLTEALGGARFTFHLLGGLETLHHEVLPAEEPISRGTCWDEGINGLRYGEVYQEVARLTNGLRAPLCHQAARKQLAEKLLEMPSQTASCGWILHESRHRIDMVSAVGPQRSSSRLIRERVLANCAGTHLSYRVADSLLVLCQSTCEALKNEGYDAIEVKLECTE